MSEPPDETTLQIGGVTIQLFGAPPTAPPGGAPSVDRDPASICKGPDGVWRDHHPVVDKVARTVACGHCKQPLDAIDVLLRVAHQHDAFVRMIEATRTARRELAELRDEEKRVKARTKTHARKDAAAAVEAERKRHDEQRRIIAYTTDEVRAALDKIDRQIGRLQRRRRP